jgi:hypothetical protein
MTTIVHKTENTDSTALMIGLFVIGLIIAFAVFYFGKGYLTPMTNTNTYNTTKTERVIYEPSAEIDKIPNLNVEVNTKD